MNKIIFQKNHEELFKSHGLNTFRDIYYFSKKHSIGRNARRDVSSFSLKDSGGEKTFFIKRFKIPYLKDMFFAFRNCGKISSQAELEFTNANALFDIGVQTYRPVCYGEHRVAGIELRSFIITEKLNSHPLTEFVAKNWQKLSTDKKLKIIQSVARLIRRIHDAGITLTDLYVWHIFISEPDLNLAVIDLGRMKRNISSLTEKLKNLGRLHHSMIDKYFDEDARFAMIKAYAQNNMDAAEIYQKVKKYSQQVSKKRKPKRY